MDESHIIDLETRITYLEDILQELNTVVSKQADTIDRLVLEMRTLREQLHTAMPSLIKDASEETPPPHY